MNAFDLARQRLQGEDRALAKAQGVACRNKWGKRCCCEPWSARTVPTKLQSKLPPMTLYEVMAYLGEQCLSMARQWS
jgi:hypothetical protein